MIDNTYFIAGVVLLVVILPVAGFVMGIYWNTKSNRRQDDEALRKEVARSTTVDVKLDSILNTTMSTDRKIEKMQESISELKNKYSVFDERLQEQDRQMQDVRDNLEKQIKELYRQVGEVRSNLEKLHAEHRERVAHCHNI